MPVSKVDVINKSLTLVGAAPVTSIDDSSNNARVLNRVYDIALRSILSECKWNFATKRLLLSSSSDTMAWSYTGEAYVYVRPSDVIRIFETNDDDATWREEGDYILSDTSGLGIKYVYYIDSPSKFPAFFTDALIDKLASEIAYMIVNSSSLGEKYKMLYESVSLPKAMSANSQIGVQQTVKDDGWEMAKFNDTHPDV